MLSIAVTCYKPIIPSESRVHHVPLNDTLMVVMEDILSPALVLELVLTLLRLALVVDDPEEFIQGF